MYVFGSATYVELIKHNFTSAFELQLIAIVSLDLWYVVYVVTFYGFYF